MATLSVAMCQFPVSANLERNLAYVCRQTAQAAAAGAQLVHFPEAALSGYAGVNRSDWEGASIGAGWRAATGGGAGPGAPVGVMDRGGQHAPARAGRRPHNAVYVIGPDGALVDRYDKRFLHRTGPGALYVRRSLCRVRRARRALRRAHLPRFRYPERHRAYHRLGVQCRSPVVLQRQLRRPHHSTAPSCARPSKATPRITTCG